MPVYLLDQNLTFPPTSHAENGLLAMGGDLSPERLIVAYSSGIFPWYSEGDPILWWSPPKRMILFPGSLHISRSLKRLIKNRYFEIKSDTNFENVITSCSKVKRKHEDGTWILPEMIRAYHCLHERGYAHSFECYLEGELVGGLYGVSLGNAFFGESMFSFVSNASKVALSALYAHCMNCSFHFIDCQLHTDHLERMGAVLISRSRYLKLLNKSLESPANPGKWIFDENLLHKIVAAGE